MKTDQIYSSLLFSFCLHSLLVIAVVIYVMFFNVRYKNVIFDVSLVSPSENNSASIQRSMEAPAPQEQKSVHTTEQPEKVTPKEKSEANERIAALEAKKKIETMQRLRKTITVSTKGNAVPKGLTTGSSNSSESTYISIIGNKIHQQWLFPETADKDLLAVINIRIARNGNVTILGFEKKSGNVLFDRAAIRAINNASPLPPPSAEIEIGLKFYP